MRGVGPRFQRARRALEVTRVARRSHLLRVLREIGVVGERPATQEGAEQFRRALEELGTTYQKLGQLLSSRPDLLPDVYIEQLAKLVDEGPVVPFAEIAQTIEADIGREKFARIDEEPLATASIAQIHAALLADGREAVVKVRRPGVREQVDVDLGVLRTTVRFLEGRSEKARLLQLKAIADELEVHLKAELDLEEEAHNADLIAKLIADYDTLTTARPIRPHVTERVLVMERIKEDKVAADHGLPKKRAETLARDFFRSYIPPGDGRRRLPRRPASRQCVLDR